MALAAKVPVRMSVGEFLDWKPEGRWQLVDGEARARAPANRTHGTIQSRLAYLLTAHFERQGGDCVAVTEPGIVPRLLAEHNVRVPDLAVTCTPYETEQRTLLDPVLVVEILSPSNQAETWANVWAFTSIPSVREILILRADRIGAELLRRQADVAWPERPAAITEGDLTLDSIGLRVPLGDIYVRTRLAPR